jgi:hypothetical protein
MNPLKHLSFGSLRHGLSSVFHDLPDLRQPGKVNYPLHDALMSGFACMFFQDPSLLQLQQRLEEAKHRNNLHTLFGIHETPESTQMRTVIDQVESHHFRPIFPTYLSRLQRGKHLDQFELFPGLHLCPIDGTQYFSSPHIHCQNCLTMTHQNGTTTYAHKVIQAGIMHPDHRQVIPLMPEEINNRDGGTKQDCEVNAAKRLLPKIRQDYPDLGIVLAGDSLFSQQPFISDVGSANMHDIFVAKPTDHICMMAWIDTYGVSRMQEKHIVDDQGRQHIYTWLHDVPLNGQKDTLRVNYLDYRIMACDKDGNERIIYHNSWVTDITITHENVGLLSRAGRCRWKIENECFNTLKNQGYHIEHNYGHGSNHLCFHFYLLTLVAFYVHQVLELTDGLYQSCRQKFGSKTHRWETLRSYSKILIFETWDQLLDFAYQPSKYDVSFHPP